MTEKLLQYIWQFQYFNRTHLHTTNNEKVEVIFAGTLNKNQGPDFTNAQIKIGGTLLVGAVELHLKTSQWEQHGHTNDANYQNVVLHVVFEHDKELPHALPVLALHPHIPKMLLHYYQSLMNGARLIPCAGNIHLVKDITWMAWKERLLAERLTRKSTQVLQFLQQTNHHWEETFWWLLARNFGIKVNADAFEAMARSISINILAKHKNSIHQLEALLLGQANLLSASFSEDYPLLLQREYRFLQSKYGLHPSAITVHFLRMRPGNFPTLRLAQLAMLIHQSSHLFSKVLETASLKEVQQWLNVTANDYWHYHYRLNEPAAFKKKRMGAAMIDNIVINTIVPVLFAYGLYHKDEQYKAKALHWLEETAAEDNSVINEFTQLSITNASAFDSQALIELKNEYCHHKRCLECAVGNSILAHPFPASGGTQV